MARKGNTGTTLPTETYEMCEKVSIIHAAKILADGHVTKQLSVPDTIKMLAEEWLDANEGDPA